MTRSGARTSWPSPAEGVRRVLARIVRPGGVPPRVGRSPGAATWCEVAADGTVHLHPPVPELGQGAHTVLAQLVLEELDADPARLVVHPPDTERGFPPGWMTAVGSSTAETLNVPARRAGAAVREGLGRPRRRLVLRPRAEHRVVGTSMPRVDLPAKVTGAAVFTADVRLPGMLYAAVVLPPRHGAVLASADGLQAARSLPGVVTVVADPGAGLVAAVGARRSRADAALALLSLEWAGGEDAGEEELSAAVTVGSVPEHVLQGRAPSVDPVEETSGPAGPGARQLSAGYRTAMVAIAPPEPPVAVVDATSQPALVHSSTQNPGTVRASVARALGRRPAQVRVVVPYVGGSFGRKHGTLGDPAADAARLSAMTGRPVHLSWTREQDLAHGPKRAPTHHLLQATLGADGHVHVLQHRAAAGDGSGAWALTRRLARVSDLDPLAIFGAHVLYAGIPDLRASVARVPLPVPLTGVRSLGTFANTFAIESFVDELAAAAGADPLEFRLRHLGADDLGRRLRRVLEAAADAADWGGATAAGTARGIACSAYAKTVVAQVVDLAEVVPGDAPVTSTALFDRVRVLRVTSAVEGSFVNPDIARAQSEGGALMGLSWAAVERFRVGGGRQGAAGGRYPILDASQAPPVVTVLLDGAHWGGGVNEATAAPVGAALANAVSALTGHRSRELPLRFPA